VGDVDTVNLVALRIVDCAIECPPTEAEGPDEEIIEEPDVDQYDSPATNPPSPGRNPLEKTNHDTRALTMPWAVIGMGGADTFAPDYTLFRHLLCLLKSQCLRRLVADL